MEMVQAVLLSTLCRHYALLQKNFVERYPNAWLVWEPGRWNPPQLRLEPPETEWPPKGGSTKVSSNDDPLCFHLPALPPGQVIGVGRASSNAIVLNDATVSRQHVTLSRDDEDHWVVNVVTDTKQAFVEGVKVTPATKATLPSGGKIQLGDVVLRLFSSPDFVERLRQVAGV